MEPGLFQWQIDELLRDINQAKKDSDDLERSLKYAGVIPEGVFEYGLTIGYYKALEDVRELLGL